MSKAIITTSWDDGHPLDLKLAELLQRYAIPATFYIPIDNIERQGMNTQEIREIAQSFDVGGHTYHHIDLTRIARAEAEREIVEGKEGLEEIIDRETRSFCYPHGRFNDEIVDIVERVGFIGGRTVKMFTRSIKNPFRMGTTVLAKDLRLTARAKLSAASLDPSLFYFMLKNKLFSAGWDRIATETLDFVIRNGGVWHLWGHSWEIDDNNDWRRLKKVLLKISMLPQEVERVSNSQLIRKGWGEA